MLVIYLTGCSLFQSTTKVEICVSLVRKGREVGVSKNVRPSLNEQVPRGAPLCAKTMRHPPTQCDPWRLDRRGSKRPLTQAGQRGQALVLLLLLLSGPSALQLHTYAHATSA